VETCGESTAGLIGDLLATARALTSGATVQPGSSSLAERRARRLASADAGLARVAALDLVADAVGTLAADERLGPGGARSVVRRLARQLGLPHDAVAYRVFVAAGARLAGRRLPTIDATAALLSLFAELAPVTAVSLWRVGSSGRTTCIAGAGRGSRGSVLREAARAALDGLRTPADDIACAVVDRWDAPHAVLVARTRGEVSAVAADLLAEAAAVLSPVLEHDALLARGSARERQLASALERRLARVAFDLHDGPLQELFAFAHDVRHVRNQLDGLVDPELRDRVRGCFDDLQARMESLDGALRQLVTSLRSSTALVCALEDAVRAEVDVLRRGGGIASTVAFDGDLARLTNSQRIVAFRLVQEALANVRKHSGATDVSVSVRSTRRFLRVVVEDDGCGFDVEQTVESVRSSGHFGLAGIVERVRLLGGEVRIDARPGEGTTIRATIPHWRPVDGSPAPTYAAAV
jgi:signal transduction histidine kinase